MRKLVLALLLLLASTSLFAQDWRGGRPERHRDRDRYGYRDNYFELTPLVGYRYGGTIYADNTSLFRRDLDVDSSANVGLNLGIPINNDGMKLELLVDHQDTNLTTGANDLFGSEDRVAKFKVTYYQAGVLVPFARSRNGMTPYFAIDAGVANLDTDIPGSAAANRFAASAAVGLKLPVADNIAIRIEERGFYANTGTYGDGCSRCGGRDDTNLYQGETSLGVSFKF